MLGTPQESQYGSKDKIWFKRKLTFPNETQSSTTAVKASTETPANGVHLEKTAGSNLVSQKSAVSDKLVISESGVLEG